MKMTVSPTANAERAGRPVMTFSVSSSSASSTTMPDMDDVELTPSGMQSKADFPTCSFRQRRKLVACWRATGDRWLHKPRVKHWKTGQRQGVRLNNKHHRMRSPSRARQGWR